jgi:alanyl-tRNA synthetase
MTERLYYADPCLRAFDATVSAAERREGRLVVVLDRTAFYPTSGGQPFDTGVLGGWRVVDVVDLDDGAVGHVVDDAFAGPDACRTPGQTVHGEIDWARRFDHMQQHTGQHVLSAAFDRMFGARTVSFHLGTVASTIDIAREMTAADINAAEAEANRIVWEDRPVSIRFASREEADRMPLRKESLRDGTLRLIDVEGFDLSACGGTHVTRTGSIGMIAVASWERFKGGQRIEFLCGGRALTRFGRWRDAIGASVQLLSVLPAGLPAAIERTKADAKELKRAAAALQAEIARYRSAEFAAAAETSAAGRLVLRAVDADAGGLKAMATAIAAKPGYVAVLVSTSMPALVVVARSADVRIAASEILSALTTAFGGRGGGRPELAQAGGLNANPQAILDAARSAIGRSSGAHTGGGSPAP